MTAACWGFMLDTASTSSSCLHCMTQLDTPSLSTNLSWSESIMTVFSDLFCLCFADIFWLCCATAKGPSQRDWIASPTGCPRRPARKSEKQIARQASAELFHKLMLQGKKNGPTPKLYKCQACVPSIVGECNRPYFDIYLFLYCSMCQLIWIKPSETKTFRSFKTWQ